MSKIVLEGSDLIVSLGGVALGYSSGCKVSTSTETGERLTKEGPNGKWKEKFVKSFSESISADGLVLRNGDAQVPSYDQLKDAMIAGNPVQLHYNIREGSSREGKESGGYSGQYIITSLELDAQAGDDSKYSVQFENSGPVTKGTGGITDATALA